MNNDIIITATIPTPSKINDHSFVTEEAMANMREITDNLSAFTPMTEFEELKLENTKMKRFMAIYVIDGKSVFDLYREWEMTLDNDKDPKMRCSRCGVHIAIVGQFTIMGHQQGHYCDECQSYIASLPISDRFYY